MESVFVVTANRTDDGRAVYLTADRNWSETLADALVAASEPEQEEAIGWAGAQQREVCDPYVLPVQKSTEGLVPLSARERIRAAGPEWIAKRFGYEI